MAKYNSHTLRSFRYRENFVDQYLKSANLQYKKQGCSNGLCKVIVNGNIKLDKLLDIFFNNEFLPPIKGIYIDKFRCDGTKFSFNVNLDKLYPRSFELIDDATIKAWWRDKQIDSILKD